MEASMAGRKGARAELTTQARQELTALSRAHLTPRKLAERARIILFAADSVSVSETAQQLGIWRKRWREADAAKSTAERLSDAPRSGAPGKFTPEQICAIIALEPVRSGWVRALH